MIRYTEQLEEIQKEVWLMPAKIRIPVGEENFPLLRKKKRYHIEAKDSVFEME